MIKCGIKANASDMRAFLINYMNLKFTMRWLFISIAWLISVLKEQKKVDYISLLNDADGIIEHCLFIITFSNTLFGRDLGIWIWILIFKIWIVVNAWNVTCCWYLTYFDHIYHPSNQMNNHHDKIHWCSYMTVHLDSFHTEGNMYFRIDHGDTLKILNI